MATIKDEVLYIGSDVYNHLPEKVCLFDVEFNGIKKSFTIEEKFFTNSLADKFEQKRYEKTIKDNFVTSIKEKLIMKLIALNDN